MLDRHEAHDNPKKTVGDTRDAAASADQPVGDREVPLPGMSAADTLPDAVHLWLDGEASEAMAREADARAVSFWMKVGGDAALWREAKAPARLLANVMAALPGKAPLAD
jgi:hypothetical protein